MKRRNRKVIVATTAVIALGVPLGAHAWIVARTDALAAKLGKVAEVPTSIGSVDAGLTGTVRVSDIAIGELVTIEAIEVAVGVGDGADEIRVTAPRLDVHVDPDGDSDLARLGRKLAHARPAAPATPARKRTPRRIVVDGGSLVAQIPGIGEISADEVEVIPEDGGVRLVTGAVHVRGTVGPAQVKLAFPRAAAQIALPGVRFVRVLAVAGTGTATTQSATAVLSDLALGRLRSDGRLELHGTIDDDGERRAIGATLQFAGADQKLELAVTGTRVPLAALAGITPHALGVAHARATGSATLRIDPHTAKTELAIDASVSDLALDHPRIAPEPLPFTGTLAGTFALSHDAIVVSDLAITRGALQFSANGWLRRGAPISGQLEIAIEPAPCSQLFDALPAGLRAPLDGIVLGGELGGRAKLAIDLAAPEGEGVALDVGIANHCVAVSEPPGADVTTLAGITAQTFPDGSVAKVGRGVDGYVPIRGLPDHVAGAFVSAEDGRFREHHGFDPTQIARSLEIDLREHRLARGGSTISQQLVKNAFLTHRRSLDRKVQEAILTWRLEARLDKAQILERYLNIIELGPHIYGIGAAAKYWFGTTPAKLSIRQAAFLAALTSAPTSMSARVRAARGLDTESRGRVDTILRAMRRDGVIAASEHDVAKSAALAWAPTVITSDGY